jgi:NTP pyrophosphatase (non-canonical NTP hydrolase)
MENVVKVWERLVKKEREKHMKTANFDDLNRKILRWALDKGILEYDNRFKQLAKVLEELGELSAAMLRNEDVKIIDSIGDALVTIIILSGQLGFNPESCLASAWEEIKDRTGETREGIFIKS